MFEKVSFICLSIIGIGISGCSPLHPGSLGTQARTSLRSSEIASQKQSPPNPMSDLATRSQPTKSCETKGGYCESCGTVHGQTQSAPFKFSQPIPEFQTTTGSRDTTTDDLSVLGQQLVKEQSQIVRVEPTLIDEIQELGATQKSTSEIQSATEIPVRIDSVALLPDGSQTPHSESTSTPINEVETFAKHSPDNEQANSPPFETNIPPAPPQPDDDMAGTQPKQPTPTPVPDASSSLREVESPVATAASSSKPNVGLLIQQLRQFGSDKVAVEQTEQFEKELEALELIARRVQESLDGGQASPQANELFHHQIAALVATLKPDSLDLARADGRKNASESLRHLHQATMELEQLVSLNIHKGALCSVVRGYGQYDRLPTYVLKAGQSVLLYCEIENFQSKLLDENESELSYCTRLKSSLVICDEHGSVVQQADFPPVEDHARNRRRDFYLHVPFTIGELPPGTYRVHLVVDDVLGCKQASLEPAIEFCVK